MQKRFSGFILAVLLICSFSVPVSAEGYESGQESLTLFQGSADMIHNGTTVTATQPLAASKGVTYVAARSIMKEFYGTIVYDSKTKQYSLSSGAVQLRFTAGKTSYLANGIAKQAVGAPYVVKGTLMVPLKTLTQNFGVTLKSYPAEKRLELTWNTKPTAKFSISTLSPYATQTDVYYTDEYYHPRGLKIIDERWENNFTRFEYAGEYVITRWVQDENGVWSDPYSVTIMVKPPNQPPVAMFATEKDTYMMGEYIRYTDLSSDDEDRIASVEWNNAEKAFFEPGAQIVTLKVTDANGASSEFQKTITITDQTKYTREEFNLLYTDIGDKFTLDGQAVLNYPVIDYFINPSGQMTFIRANSPETMREEGIYYEDEVSGNVRLLIHNLNGRDVSMKVYVIATNTNAEEASVRVGPVGIGGPNPHVSSVGRAAVGRFLESRLGSQTSKVTIPAGESRLLFTEYSDKAIKPGYSYSMYGDMVFDKNIKIQVVAVNAERNVFGMLPYLNILPSNDKHIRGTFHDANRFTFVNEPIGDKKSRMVLADNVIDSRLTGIDKTTGIEVINAGNYGTLYTMNLFNVQPHTAILVNPRGGYYAGAFTVNGKVVYATNSSILTNRNEVGVLHRTGDEVEKVTIVFTPAAGSALPINFLFMPLPQS